MALLYRTVMVVNLKKLDNTDLRIAWGNVIKTVERVSSL